MAVTFDGNNLIITLPAATATIDVETDLYSDWKEWMKTGTNARYLQAFSGSEGGAPVTATLSSGSYFFLRNDLGWRIRPAEEDATVTFTGNLVPTDLTLPMTTPTVGPYTVMLVGLQPITTIAIGEGGGTDWTTSEKDQIRDALGIDGSKIAAIGGQLQGLVTNADELHRIAGLNAAAKLTVSESSRKAGSITQLITSNYGSVTMQRT